MTETRSRLISGLECADGRVLSRRPSNLEDEIIALFDELRAPLLRYLQSFSIPVCDAEEIVQEVFIALFRHLRDGKSRDSLHGWIFRVAHNLGLKHRTRNRQHKDLFANDSGVLLNLMDSASGADERIEWSQRQQRLLAVANALPEQDRQCLSLRAEGLRYREIAGILGIALGSVANSLSKSLARLRRAEES